MNDSKPPYTSASSLPPANSVTRRAHRRQVLRQIAAPFVLVILLLAGAIYILSQSELASVERWAEISSMLLIAVFVLVLLIPLALVGALICITARLMKELPPYARQTQLAIERVKSQVRSGADISVQPMMQIQSFLAMLDTLIGRRK
ncbi:MAG: hypothetical protein IIC79_01145 [Chloroflexi bacterium]|nr:hypothetical protein [Chloroflexota bacterium]